jgi:polysaccharide export outer membrane protein
MIYMSNHHFGDEVNQARYTGLRIKAADMLEVKVSAFDEIAVSPLT